MSAQKPQTSKHGSGHRHPPELRERAVRMVEETIKQTGERHGVVTRVAVQLGARPATTEIVSFINQYKERFGVEPICQTLEVAPSTYYAAVSRPPQPAGFAMKS